MGTPKIFSFQDIREVDGDLAKLLDRLDERQVPRFEGVALDEGSWTPPEDGPALGYLVMSGFVVRRVEVAGGSSIELFGPGQLLHTHDTQSADDQFDMLPTEVEWIALSHAALASLGSAFATAAIREPALHEAMVARDSRRAHALMLRLALAQLPLASSRLHFLLWHLANRFGRVGRSGVLVPIRLPRDVLGEMVSCAPGDVRGALRELTELGVVSQAPRGWWLHGSPPAGDGSGLPSPAELSA